MGLLRTELTPDVPAILHTGDHYTRPHWLGVGGAGGVVRPDSTRCQHRICDPILVSSGQTDSIRRILGGDAGSGVRQGSELLQDLPCVLLTSLNGLADELFPESEPRESLLRPGREPAAGPVELLVAAEVNDELHSADLRQLLLVVEAVEGQLAESNQSLLIHRHSLLPPRPLPLVTGVTEGEEEGDGVHTGELSARFITVVAGEGNTPGRL